MSYYYQSPSRSPIRQVARSPFRSPVRLLETQRDLIRHQMNLQRSIRRQAEANLQDQLSLLKIKLRKTQELQVSNHAILSQNLLLKQQNQNLTREIAQRKYQTDRYKSHTIEIQQRDTLKNAQLLQLNHNLNYELSLLQKQKNESNLLYQTHIKKLQLVLQEKITDLDTLGAKYNKLINEKQLLDLTSSEQINKLKVIMARNSHQLQAQFQYKKEKQYNESLLEIQNMKKNHASQILILQDQIKKLSVANNIKNNQISAHLNQNKSLRLRFDNQIKNLIAQNDSLRQRMAKLQQLNKTDIEKIQSKYSDHHTKDTTVLKEQFGKQIHLLLDQIDKLKWLINQKNTQIQTLIRQKRDQRKNSEDRQFEFTSAIDTLKNKLQSQEQISAKQGHTQMSRIDELSNKLLRESQNYHERIKSFNKRISDLESQIKHKQNIINKIKQQNDLSAQQSRRNYDQLQKTLNSKQINYLELQNLKNRQNQEALQYKNYAERTMIELNKKIKELQVDKDSLNSQLQKSRSQSNNQQDLLNQQINSLKQRVNALEKNLTDQQNKYTSSIDELSQKMRKRIESLQSTQQRTIQYIQNSRNQEIEALNLRVSKLNVEKDKMAEQLNKYVSMYDNLQKYFVEPHQGVLYDRKGQSKVYEVLSKVSKSSVHIF